MKPYTGYSHYRADLESNAVAVTDTVENFLAKIEANKELNAFLEVFAEEARQQAIIVQEKLKAGTAGQLAGMVIGIKDNIVYKGHKVSAASRILQGFESLFSATVIERLLAADAIIIGRLNCDEFAMGSSNENSAYGKVLNSLDKSRVPGGSSGASAVAVAAGLCHATLGTDTGGSIRQPASFCGVVGLKPSYGRVSRWGAIAYASSFDQIGPITVNTYDSALLLEVMAGADAYDSTAVQSPVPLYTKAIEQNRNKKYTFAFLKETLESPGLNPEIKAYFNQLFDTLKSQGHQIVAVDFPYLDYLVPTYYVLTTAEASSNLSRYDGIHYGYRSNEAVDLETTYKKSRAEGFGKEVKRRIMLGTFVLSSGYYDAYYGKAQKVRRLIREATESIFSKADFIILPTTPDVAFEFGKNSSDPIKMYLEDIFTVQANLTGNPAISLPLGKSNNGLPFGIQLMGKSLEESELLSVSVSLEALKN